MKRKYFLNSADTPFDCHCHILPGLDDGSTSLEESLYLAGRLVAYGFRRAVCTSHSTSKYRNSPETRVSGLLFSLCFCVSPPRLRP